VFKALARCRFERSEESFIIVGLILQDQLKGCFASLNMTARLMKSIRNTSYMSEEMHLSRTRLLVG